MYLFVSKVTKCCSLHISFLSYCLYGRFFVASCVLLTCNGHQCFVFKLQQYFSCAQTLDLQILSTDPTASLYLFLFLFIHVSATVLNLQWSTQRVFNVVIRTTKPSGHFLHHLSFFFQW